MKRGRRRQTRKVRCMHWVHRTSLIAKLEKGLTGAGRIRKTFVKKLEFLVKETVGELQGPAELLYEDVDEDDFDMARKLLGRSVRRDVGGVVSFGRISRVDKPDQDAVVDRSIQFAIRFPNGEMMEGVRYRDVRDMLVPEVSGR